MKGWQIGLGLLASIGVGLTPSMETAIGLSALPSPAGAASAAPLPQSPAAAVAPGSFPSFNSQRLDQQLRLYADYLQTVGRPDVLIVGSSRSLQGIDPTVLQQALASQGYPNLKVYNFGINGATARVIDLLLSQILTPDQMPRLLIWADGSRAFNSGRTDITYNSIVASAGYRLLTTGVYPIRPQLEAAFAPPCSEPSLNETAENLPAAPSADAFYAPFYALEGSADRSPAPVEMPPIGEARSDIDLGCPPPALDSIPLESGTRTSIAVDLDRAGFQTVSARFNPATYYRRYPRVAGRYDTNYAPFRLVGEQTAATIAIAQFAQAQRIPLVFVNLPLSQDYLDRVRQRYEQQFRQHIQQLANRQGFIFRDLSQRWRTQNDYFADPSHLNQNGARAVARQLAIDPAIPWQVALPPLSQP